MLKLVLVGGAVVAGLVVLLGLHYFLLVLAVVLLLAAVFFFFLFQLDKAMFVSIPVVPPPASWHVDELQCALFRFLPELKGKVAWKPLGNFPTPMEAGELTLEDGSKRRVFFKREDKASKLYGGNKVRTLEYQLACAAAAARPGSRATVLSLGASGSNQVVAVATHVRAHPELQSHPLLMLPDAQEHEGGLNAFSGSSLAELPSAWQLSALPPLVRALFLNRDNWRNCFVSPPGGANVAGALGHVAAALEAAESRPDAQHIVLPLGSGCTTAGLLVGVAVARQLGRGFARLRRVFSVTIHPMFSLGDGLLVRKLIVPRLVTETAACLARLGGPDVRAEAARLLAEVWRPISHHCGPGHGEPTPASRRARELPPAMEDGGRGPWLCHCFSSKAMAFLHEALADGTIPPDEEVLFWCTKSLVQPAGAHDVFERPGLGPVLDYMRACDINGPNDFFKHPDAIRI